MADCHFGRLRRRIPGRNDGRRRGFADDAVSHRKNRRVADTGCGHRPAFRVDYESIGRLAASHVRQCQLASRRMARNWQRAGFARDAGAVAVSRSRYVEHEPVHQESARCCATAELARNSYLSNYNARRLASRRADERARPPPADPAARARPWLSRDADLGRCRSHRRRDFHFALSDVEDASSDRHRRRPRRAADPCFRPRAYARMRASCCSACCLPVRCRA